MTNAKRDLIKGLVLLGLLAWGMVALCIAVADYLATLQSDMAVAVVAAGATAIVSVLSLAVGKAYEARAANRQELRSKKTPVCEEIVSTLYALFLADRVGKRKPTEKELMEFFVSTTEQLTIWGSDDIIKAYSALRNHTLGDRPVQGMLLLERLLFAIRKDLGHKNRGLRPGSLLKLFVNDIDEHINR